MNKDKYKLFRKVNTKTFNVHHKFGGDYNDTRNSKKEILEQAKGKMSAKKERGLNYTPL